MSETARRTLQCECGVESFRLWFDENGSLMSRCRVCDNEQLAVELEEPTHE